MFSFLFRLAAKAAVVQKFRFVSLTATLTIAALVLVILSALYLNGKLQMEVELSGVPNMEIEPQNTLLSTDRLPFGDIEKIKSEDYFWHNNMVNLAPVTLSSTTVNGIPVKVAGTWFNKKLSVDGQSYNLGLLRFANWKYSGSAPDANSMILGANVRLSDPVELNINGRKKTFHIAGKINTGSFWDDYIFVDSNALSGPGDNKGFDKILVSALFKPDDQLAVRVERDGIGTLSPKEADMWSCAPYIANVAQTLGSTLPDTNIKILRRITEVQAGIIKTSTGIFLALFMLTLIASITAIYSAEKMYVTSHLKDFGIMAAIGASQKKIFAQLLTEIFFASILSAVIIWLLSNLLVNYISMAVYGVSFDAKTTLIVVAVLIPCMVSSFALWLLRKNLRQDTVKLLS